MGFDKNVKKLVEGLVEANPFEPADYDLAPTSILVPKRWHMTFSSRIHWTGSAKKEIYLVF